MLAVVFITDLIVGLESLIDGRLSFLLPTALYAAIYIFIGYDVLISAFKNILRGQVFDEKFLMCVASLGAFTLAILRSVNGKSGEGYEEACVVMLLFQTGEFFEKYATGKSRKSIAKLMELRPDYANVLRSGEIVTVSPEEVAKGEIIVVNPGEKVPLDGKIVKGSTSLDCKALSGESEPKEALLGDDVISGSVNLTSKIEVEVVSEFYDSTVSKILELVDNAASQKSKTENFITKFAKYYTPTVVIAALLLAVVPSVITKDVSTWVYRALNFLVVSCPCALVISVPLAFVAGIGAASKNGVLVKGGNYLELIDKVKYYVFDKTGTLTEGNFKVVGVTPSDRAGEILRLASEAESFSNHPIAESIKRYYGEKVDLPDEFENVVGKGVIAKSKGSVILCGNISLMEEQGINAEVCEEAGERVYVAKDGKFVGSILIADKIKDEAKEVIDYLSQSGKHTAMLTGDREEIAASVAKKLGLSTYRGGLLPHEKVDELEKLLKKRENDETLCFIGDGINDAPVLMRADVGIAMGGLGSDAAIEASDVVLMNDDLRSLSVLGKIAKKTVRIVKENVWFSLAIKFAILALSVFGITNMWIAVFGDVGVAILAILNSMRINVLQNTSKSLKIRS